MGSPRIYKFLIIIDFFLTVCSICLFILILVSSSHDTISTLNTPFMTYYPCAPHCCYWYNHTSWCILEDWWLTYFQSPTTVDSVTNDTSSWELAALPGFNIFRIYSIYHWFYVKNMISVIVFTLLYSRSRLWNIFSQASWHETFWFAVISNFYAYMIS